jgi:hypothetical protein
MATNADRAQIGLRVIPPDTERDVVIVFAAGRRGDLDLTHRAFAPVPVEHAEASGGGEGFALHLNELPARRFAFSLLHASTMTLAVFRLLRRYSSSSTAPTSASHAAA